MSFAGLSEAVALASTRPEVVDAVRSLYADLQSQIDLRKPRCDVSGRCCHFESYGHRLYVTTLELAAFVHDLSPTCAPPAPWDGGGCPFQIGKLCGVHAIRPMGCRIFFCDPSARQWQQDQYELLHRRLKTLHKTLNVPYLYVEWRAALGALKLAAAGA